jgi:EAL domain-containing protein (putative c-di-GMP-specific phosphodiesterase class I)
MHERIVQRLEMEADLRRALEREELELHYQPIVSLADGRITGVEALLRWRRPGHGIVAPMTFIPLAEETGLILPIGRWVLHEATRQAQAWQQSHRDRAPRMAVNVSGRHLRDPQVVTDLRDALTASGLAPSLLTIEITESVLMEQSDEVVARLHELKALGITLAIDDFGTGYSSLSYLQRFPVDVLKIDKAFVDEVGRPALDAPLARAIIGLAETLQLRTVAEGVELAGQVTGLRDLGCDLAQGFHFSRPVVASALELLMTRASLTPSAGTETVVG